MDGGGSRAGSKGGYIIRVASETRDILLHPLERHYDVHNTYISGAFWQPKIQESWNRIFINIEISWVTAFLSE